ncbi:MAG: DUF389 domain-containing protein, partial [Bacteroidota bacterium]
DISLLRKAIYNFILATGVALATSTIFFLLSPLSDAHSEILARTSPNIYDVLIAFFGGLAGILATSSKHKGNVIPGVAIATALMPPLCTAGYGLATLQLSFFFGAFYLFIINTVFIALSTFIIIRLLHFPLKDLHSVQSEKRAKRIVWFIVLLTLLPSIYFGFDIVQQNRFTKNANRFITNEAHFTNDYLLNKKIDAKAESITLVFGGKEISPEEIQSLKFLLTNYQLDSSALEVKQGFAYLSDTKNKESNEQFNQLTNALEVNEKQLHLAQLKFDSLHNQQKLSVQVYSELKVQYPKLKSAIIEPSISISDSSKQTKIYLVLLNIPVDIPKSEKNKIENWLKIRLNQANLKLIFQ